ncbi:hypothetical protein [Anaerococcus sp. mt242]|uniref:hypothetical protein n=1 Tax=unclassified Anaerococcus TaxID=2614126 RepID=UPI0019340B03|nr:hypothetical protein [Anaerococcus sp. mt242]MBM0045771.1 hypothetical protein [Anaerococcus sp. mt242]
MDRRKVNRKLKKNKYRIIISIVAILSIILIAAFIHKKNIESAIAKYDNEILIVKGNGDQLDSLTLKEIRKSGGEKKTISINNGLEKVDIEGVSIDKIIGNLNINLKDRAVMLIEDNDGNQKRLSMSAALEPERVYLVYKIDGSPVFDLNQRNGKMLLIDTSADSSASWVRNVKTIDIE